MASKKSFVAHKNRLQVKAKEIEESAAYSENFDVDESVPPPAPKQQEEQITEEDIDESLPTSNNKD